jgi:hypothetical protein
LDERKPAARVSAGYVAVWKVRRVIYAHDGDGGQAGGDVDLHEDVRRKCEGMDPRARDDDRST